MGVCTTAKKNINNKNSTSANFQAAGNLTFQNSGNAK